MWAKCDRRQFHAWMNQSHLWMKVSSVDIIHGWKWHPWMEESHQWIKVSSVDDIYGQRYLIHGWHKQMRMTDDGHGQSIFSLPLTSFPMIEPGFQSLLRELFHCSPELFRCSPELFRCSPELFHRSPGAFPLQPRNQASKTKCQHSSSLISSIKKRNL